ncbi:hypothetical protein [Pseudonocardia sp. TRM90224]|uniref:hypothetical protein n=1 Tax=Pseudonocardia sp. TRM90224 TaxID=2812678 RepID=UPI001E3A9185|nr:hypothetical protein [Pseudonocardia sp. TRM90224]
MPQHEQSRQPGRTHRQPACRDLASSQRFELDDPPALPGHQVVRTWAAGLLGGLVLVTLTACSNAPPPVEGASGPASTTTSAPGPRQVAEVEAVTAYRAMWDAFAVAARTTDWASPELARYATGFALQQMRDGLQADEVQGEVSVGEFILNPVVTSARPEEAPTVVRVLDCGDQSRSTRIRVADGVALPNELRRHRIEAEVRVDNHGVWKVDDFRVREPGSC